MTMRAGGCAWVAGALAVVAGCSEKGAAPAARAPQAAAVTVAQAETGTLPVQVRTVGNVQPVAEVVLRPQVQGQVVETPVREGTYVDGGTTLIVLDERPYQALLAQAKATADRDRAVAEDDRRTASQYAAAQASNAANKQEMESAAAKAAASEAAVHADEAMIRTAELNVEFCRIKAPFAGRLGTLLVKPGAIVKANETDLLDIAQLRPIEVGFSVPERWVEAVRSGQAKAPLRVEASISGDSRPVIGSVSFIDNRVDTNTGTIRLKGRFDNQDERLWPGQFVDVVLTLDQEEGVVIPADAVQASQQGQAVWVVKADQTAEMRPVTVRRTVEGRAVIDKGVQAGETVVTDGQLRLAPGIKVEIKTAAAGENSRATESQSSTAEGKSGNAAGQQSRRAQERTGGAPEEKDLECAVCCSGDLLFCCSDGAAGA